MPSVVDVHTAFCAVMFVVLGLRQAIRDVESKKLAAELTADVQPAAAESSSDGAAAAATTETAETVAKRE